jgi:3-methyladenine DNA glycosylase AlkD
MSPVKLHPYWQPLVDDFRRQSSPEVAAGAKRYMRDQYAFFGIKSPERRAALSGFLSRYGIPAEEKLPELVRNAWAQQERELQYAAMELLQKRIKKMPVETLELCEELITQKSWWDTVDFIAPNLAGMLLMRFPEQRDTLIEQWMDSGNFWLQRSCLLFQLRYKKQTDEQLLFQLCTRLAGEKEFFIRKAIGWALRQHAKFAPEAVIDFVHRTPLQPLSKREALKHF